MHIARRDTVVFVGRAIGIVDVSGAEGLAGDRRTGDPEAARVHFERAIEISGGRDLSMKVEYARGYARLLYERELHDRLLTEVVEADPNAPRLTLTNTIAQRDARLLLDSADDYF